MFALADALAVGRASFLVSGAKRSASVKRLKHQTSDARRDGRARRVDNIIITTV